MADSWSQERTVLAHGFEIKALKEAVERGDATTMDIRKDVEKLEESHTAMREVFMQWKAAAEATERHARDITNKAITVKQFYVGVGALIVAIAALVIPLLVR